MHYILDAKVPKLGHRVHRNERYIASSKNPYTSFVNNIASRMIRYKLNLLFGDNYEGQRHKVHYNYYG